MNAILQSLIATVLPWITRAVELWMIYAAGRARSKNEQLEKEVAIKDEQSRIAADRPVDRDDVLRRLRDDGL